jgi:NhaP-type Na+/H+ or K+/H+ antiporter
MSTGARRLGTLAAALSSFALAVAFSGNGFIAAFVAGIAFTAALDQDAVDADTAVELPELLGEVLALAAWFLFGATLVPIALHNFDLTLLAYALLSLTVVRMAPVALSLLGTGLDRRTVVFVGWFGPRGLASVVFALLAVEQLGDIPVVERAVAVVALTVFLSVVLHGVTAGPLGRRYVHDEQADEDRSAGPRSRRPA